MNKNNKTPKKEKDYGKPENKIAYYKSSLGLIELQAGQEELISVNFQEEKLHQETTNSILSNTKNQLSQYFQGKRKKFTIPLRIEGTDFEKAVWKQLLEIPYGTTFSYKEVAEAIGNDRAYRAVGNANNKNKLSIIIPCHRVTKSSGEIGGYGAEVWRKKWLLELENNQD